MPQMEPPFKRRWLPAIVLVLAFLPSMSAQIPEQYPRPLVHTSTNHPASRVLLLSIDGLHAFDLAAFVAAHPHSALAELAARGVTYTAASTPVADPLAGLAALATGGTPLSNGIIHFDGFDRSGQSPAVSRVNTIFEVVHDKIGPTAWAGEDAATTNMLRGPSGKGLDQACALVSDDEARVQQLIHLFSRQGCNGTADSPVPALSGMSFTGFAKVERTTGYTDAAGTPSAALLQELSAIDNSISTIIATLKTQHLYSSTWIAVVSPYGESPVDPLSRHTMLLGRIRAAVAKVAPDALLHIAGGGTAMLWISNPAQVTTVVNALSTQTVSLGIRSIRYGTTLALTVNPPARDSRMPDIILEAKSGVFWTSPSDGSVASFGGTSDEDTHVALLVSGSQLVGRMDPTPVPTTQLAPLLLRSLGMEKFDLQALHLEHSPALPGIF